MTIGEIEKRLAAEFPGKTVDIVFTVRSDGDSDICIRCVYPKAVIERCRSVPDAIQKMRDALQPINVGKVQIQT